jgi:zona occludens toxin (predicted ATPase)
MLVQPPAEKCRPPALAQTSADAVAALMIGAMVSGAAASAAAASSVVIRRFTGFPWFISVVAHPYRVGHNTSRFPDPGNHFARPGTRLS